MGAAVARSVRTLWGALMRVTAYHLAPRGPMHFGGRGAGVEGSAEACRADTFFGALCHAVLDLEGDACLRAMLDAFLSGHAPFLVSSLFPRAGDVRFVPRPRLRAPIAVPPPTGVATASATATETRARKQGKQLRFVSWEVAAQAVAGGAVRSPAEDGANGVAGAVVGGAGDPRKGYAVWLSHGERGRLRAANLWEEPAEKQVRDWWQAGSATRVPRVTVDRETGASAIFHAGRLLFRPGAGLSVLFRWHDPSWRPIVERALHLLGDTGIGGERAIGHGQFDVGATEEVDLSIPAGANGFVTLAPYCPTAAELGTDVRDGVLGEGAAWDLATHGGWMGVPGVALRHATVTMLAEGSALRAPAGVDLATATFGQLLDVTPVGYDRHRVYRYGYAFPWPAVLPTEEVPA